MLDPNSPREQPTLRKEGTDISWHTRTELHPGVTTSHPTLV
jgi:hypothetical protein